MCLLSVTKNVFLKICKRKWHFDAEFFLAIFKNQRNLIVVSKTAITGNKKANVFSWKLVLLNPKRKAPLW